MNLKRRGTTIKKILAVSVVVVLVVVVLVGVALVTPGGADVLRGNISRLSVTDPGTLGLLGAALISLGVWTRRTLLSQRRERQP